MVIVRVIGGLGNQMYQYALYRKFQSIGTDACLSLSYFSDPKLLSGASEHGQYYLLRDTFTNLKERFSEPCDETKYIKMQNHKFIRQLAKVGMANGYYIEDVRLWNTVYHPNILKQKSAFFHGYWQSIKYFRDILPELKNEFVFKDNKDCRNSDTRKDMLCNQSVSIHVRRGDYLKTSMFESLDNSYYGKAIAIAKTIFENPVFYVFSDDIEWCRNNLNIEAKYIDWNKYGDSYMDMYLMSMCKVNILANSTFSIWGGLLNDNEPTVIHPYRYFSKGNPKRDIWPEEWIEVRY